MNTQEDIQNRLFEVGQRACTLLKFPPEIDFVNELARYGAQRIEAYGFLNDEHKIKLAEANFEYLLMRFSDEISKGQASSGGPISVILHRLGLCPLFPFC